MSNPAKESRQTNAGKGKGSQGKKPLTFRKNVQALFPVTYDKADAAQVLLCIDAVTRAGGAIMFGLTSDGGAYSIVVLSEDGKAKEYPHSEDELRDTLQSIIDYYV